MSTELLTPNDLAEYFKIPRSAVLAKVRSQEWPHLRINKNNVRFTSSHLEAIEEMATVEITKASTAKGLARLTK